MARNRGENYWNRWNIYQATGSFPKRKQKNFDDAAQIAKEPESTPAFTQEPLFEMERPAPTQKDFDDFINAPGISEKHRRNRRDLVGDHGPILGWAN
jgi:hypothetical protein